MTDGVLVLSPPRSGSSCLTACISFQGFHLGKNATTVKNRFNAKGYFENQAVLTFNESVLSAVGAGIFQTGPLTPRQAERTLQYKTELQALLEHQFVERPFLIKDPRIALLRELYFSVLPPVRIVALRREKKAAANSIHHLTHSLSCETVSPTIGEQICDNYFRIIDDICRETPSITVHFEDLIAQPVAVMTQLCDFLDVPLTEEGKARSQEFIDQTLVRF